MDRPVSCVVCSHPQSAQIDADLARGVPARIVAVTYKVPIKRLSTHYVSHSKLAAAAVGRPARKLVW